MKNKNLYIIMVCAFIAMVICTCVSFTTPTADDDTSVLTTPLQLVESSFTDNNILTLNDSSELEIITSSIHLFPLSSLLSSDGVNTNLAKEEDSVNELSVLSLSRSLVEDSYEMSILSDSEASDSTSDSDEVSITTNTSKEKSSGDTDTKSEKKEETAIVEESITIFSISNSECEDGEIGISIADSYVNIRSEASTDSSIVGKLYKDSAAHIIKKEGDFYYISSGNVKGYVNADYILSDLSEEELNKYGTKTASVATDALNVRKKASTDSKKVDVIYAGESYPVTKEKGEWIEIKIEDDDVSGYIKSEYVNVKMLFTEAISIEEEQALQKAEEAKKQAAAQSSFSTSSKTTTTYGSKVSADVDDLMLLACLVHSEAGNQSYEGKLAVANIVLNRMKSGKFPNSIKGVVYQSGQFSVASSGSLQKQLNQYSKYNSSSQKLSIQAAKDALDGVNNVGSRLYFNTYKVAINRGKGGSNSLKIGDHLFW